MFGVLPLRRQERETAFADAIRYARIAYHWLHRSAQLQGKLSEGSLECVLRASEGFAGGRPGCAAARLLEEGTLSSRKTAEKELRIPEKFLEERTECPQGSVRMSELNVSDGLEKNWSHLCFCSHARSSSAGIPKLTTERQLLQYLTLRPKNDSVNQTCS